MMKENSLTKKKAESFRRYDGTQHEQKLRIVPVKFGIGKAVHRSDAETDEKMLIKHISGPVKLKGWAASESLILVLQKSIASTLPSFWVGI
jgi:hypothetical protein